MESKIIGIARQRKKPIDLPFLAGWTVWCWRIRNTVAPIFSATKRDGKWLTIDVKDQRINSFFVTLDIVSAKVIVWCRCDRKTIKIVRAYWQRCAVRNWGLWMTWKFERTNLAEGMRNTYEIGDVHNVVFNWMGTVDGKFKGNLLFLALASKVLFFAHRTFRPFRWYLDKTLFT